MWEGLGRGESFVRAVEAGAEARVEHGDGAREWFGTEFGRGGWIRMRRESLEWRLMWEKLERTEEWGEGAGGK